jgi:hypothetical protein
MSGVFSVPVFAGNQGRALIASGDPTVNKLGMPENGETHVRLHRRRERAVSSRGGMACEVAS